ncbi:unnamed protein product [Aphanomyces euteiches]
MHHFEKSKTTSMIAVAESRTKHSLPAMQNSIPVNLPKPTLEEPPVRVPRAREPRPKKDSNVFVKITASVIKSKVPSLFATTGSTVHVIEVRNKVTNNSFKIGKTFADFDLIVKEIQSTVGDKHHCDNSHCKGFISGVKEIMPPRSLISRTADVVRFREESFQNLLDFWFRFINTSRQSTCQVALAGIPNLIIVFLFDRAKMNKRRFWIPPQRSHRGKRLPRAMIEEALRLAEEERLKAAEPSSDPLSSPPSSPVAAEGVAESAVIESILRRNGSGVVDVDAEDAKEDLGAQVANMMQSMRILLDQVEDPEQLANIEAEMQEILRHQRSAVEDMAREASYKSDN